MESRLKALQQRRVETEATLAKIRADLGAAKKAWDAESAEALIAECTADAKLGKAVSDLERQVDGLERTLVALATAITIQARREEADQDQEKARRIAQFRKTQADALKQINAHLQGLHDGISAFFHDLQDEHVPLDNVDIANFLFGAPNGHGGFELGTRSAKINLVNATLAWLTHDAGYSRGGRPERRA